VGERAPRLIVPRSTLGLLHRCNHTFRRRCRSGPDYLREGDTLLVTKIDRLARSTSDLYRIISLLAEKGVAFRVTDDPSIDTTSRTGKLVMGILALIAEFENDVRRERQMDGIAKARERGVKFGRKAQLVPEVVDHIRGLRHGGAHCDGDHSTDPAFQGVHLSGTGAITAMSV
jgi:DNA invertase Pin-like site-specific DNA recombinase